MPQNTTKPKPRKEQPALSHTEIDRLAEMLAIDLEGDAIRVGRTILLFDHLDSLRNDPVMLNCAIFSVKQKLFAATSASSDAQQEFEQKAKQEKGKLLRWPQAV